MRILHVVKHVRDTGNGIVNVAIDLACLQARDGQIVAVASSGGDNVALLSANGVRHFTLDQSRSPWPLVRLLPAFAAIVRDFVPDVIHVHMVTGMLLAKLTRPLSRYRIVATVHNEFRGRSVLMGSADRVIAVSEAIATAIAGRGTPAGKIRVVTNGTLGSPRRPQFEGTVPLALHRPAIVTVAGMNSRKGIADLISAFAEVAACQPQAHLYLVGDGPDRAVFESQAAATAVGDRIHFEGFQSEPQRYLGAADIFVLASHADPAPLVLIEAREAGCAIVATAVDGIPELLDGGAAGVLVPPHEPQALAAAMLQLLAAPGEIDTWRVRARRNLAPFTVARVARETTAVYHELVSPPALIRPSGSGPVST